MACARFEGRDQLELRAETGWGGEGGKIRKKMP